MVRPLTGSATGKTYRCPGCDQEIRPGTPHVVTWPAYARDSDLDPWDTESSADWRRHWHTACWRARDRRREADLLPGTDASVRDRARRPQPSLAKTTTLSR